LGENDIVEIKVEILKILVAAKMDGGTL